MLNVLDGVCTTYLGNATGIPFKVAYMIALAVRIIQIVVPILLIIWGMLDLGKAVIAQKEDEIKKGQSTFIKRLIVVVIVKLLVGLVSDDEGGTLAGCIDEVLDCKNSTNCVG